MSADLLLLDVSLAAGDPHAADLEDTRTACPDAARSCGTPTELCGTGADTFLSVKIHELGVLLSP